MNLLTIMLFFIYTWGIGFTLTSLISQKTENQLERHIMNVGIGLATLPILIVLLNLLRIPLDWRIFLALSLLYPIIYLLKFIKKKEFSFKPSLKLKKSTIYIIIALLIFLATFYIYHKGAFAYDYLEDDDPWGHASAAKYISIEKTAYDPPGKKGVNEDLFPYIDPYPPAYDAIMGILHQTSPSLSWTLKFFNALIISLGILFFYFFAKEFIKDQNKALFATFALAAIPSYLSHFIWAHALIPTLFFPALYCFEKIKESNKWAILAAITTSGILVSQLVEQPLKIGIMLLLYFTIKSLLSRKFLIPHFTALAASFLLSLLWYGNMILKYGGIGGLTGSIYEPGSTGATALQNQTSFFSSIASALKTYFIPYGGTATRAYTFNDFFIAQPQNMINNPIGIGIAISILIATALLYILIKYKSLLKEENSWLLITLAWLIFTFLGVNSKTFDLPVGLVAFRFWMLLAIPVSLIAAEGMWALVSVSKKLNIPAIFILLIAIGSVIGTSAYQKYSVNTAQWPPGKAFTSYEEANDFVWLKQNTPLNAKVYSYSRPKTMIGLDKSTCLWCDNFINFSSNAIEKDMNTAHSWLKANNYEYIVFSNMDVLVLGNKYGQENVTLMLNQRVNEAASMPDKFKIVHNTKGFVLFSII